MDYLAALNSGKTIVVNFYNQGAIELVRTRFDREWMAVEQNDIAIGHVNMVCVQYAIDLITSAVEMIGCHGSFGTSVTVR